MKVKFTNREDPKNIQELRKFFKVGTKDEFMGWCYYAGGKFDGQLEIETPEGPLRFQPGETIELKDGAYRKAV